MVKNHAKRMTNATEQIKTFSQLSVNIKKSQIFCFNEYMSLNKFQLIEKEKECLSKAICFYNKSIKYLECINKLSITKEIQLISNSIYWDASSTCFNLACIMQDYPATTDNDNSMVNHNYIEKEITDYMNRAISYLKSISISLNSEKDFSLKDINIRLGNIHHRLASLYHHLYRENVMLYFHKFLFNRLSDNDK